MLLTTFRGDCSLDYFRGNCSHDPIQNIRAKFHFASHQQNQSTICKLSKVVENANSYANLDSTDIFRSWWKKKLRFFFPFCRMSQQ